MVGMVISLVLPMAYFAVKWRDFDQNAILRGDEVTRRIRQTVRENPDLWFYAIPKFISIDEESKRYPDILSIKVYDANNTLRYSESKRDDTAWTYVFQTPIAYNNEIYGVIEIREDIRNISIQTGSLAIVFIVLGISIGCFVYRYPVKLVKEAEKEVQSFSSQAKQLADNEVARLDRLSVIGKMAAAIGHEIRNPLTTVRGYLQYFSLKKEFLAFDSQFQLMIDELDRSNGIITEFLNLAHNKAVNMVSCQLVPIIEAMYPLLQSDATIRGMSIILELQAVPDIIADEKEIRQLILNVTRNGLEAMQPQGTLTIQTAHEQDRVLLKIIDQGSGIDAAILAQIGTPFVTTKKTGTGLGLAVCYSIANRHNAKIEFSNNTVGAICTIRFPLDI